MAVRVLTAHMIAEATERVQKNERIGDVAESLGVKYITLHAALKRRGVRTAHPCGNRTRTVNEGCFSDPVSDPVAAYYIGLLMADGYASPRQSTTIALQQEDRTVLERLNELLGGGYKIRTVARNNTNGWNRSPVVRLTFACKRVTADLARFGITSDKSRTGKFPEELALNPHAWRGAVDGDGSLFLSEKRSYPCISLCGCRPLLEQFVSFVRQICPDWNGDIRKTHHEWLVQVGVSGRHAKVLARALYDGAEVAINRKAETARRIMAWEPQRIRT